MNVLVLHNNYPAQFKFLLPSILSHNHKVVFISLESHGSKIPGVKHFKVSSKSASKNHNWNFPHKGLGKKLHNADLFRVGFQKLKDSGFYPDITLFHSGWGIGCFLKSIFPKTISFAYAEWWFNWESQEASYDPNSKFSPSNGIDERIAQHYLNLTQATEISEADYVWSPTHWQKNQFPQSIQKRIEVIHEGIDTLLFKPSKPEFSLNRPINVTYTSRALEAMRCYDHFYKIFAHVMQAYPSINLTIVGKDKPVYRPLSNKSTSLFEDSFKLFRKFKINHRIKYFPRLNLQEYSSLLAGSHIHFYFSRPFIASWSLLEAMSAGCCLVSNFTPMTSEFLSHKSNALMVDSVRTEESAEKVINFLSDEQLVQRTATNGRNSVVHLDYRNQLKKLKNFIGY